MGASTRATSSPWQPTPAWAWWRAVRWGDGTCGSCWRSAMR